METESNQKTREELKEQEDNSRKYTEYDDTESAEGKEKKRRNLIEFLRKYKLEAAVLATAVVCVASMAVSAVMIFSDGGEDKSAPAEPAEHLPRSDRFTTGSYDSAEILLSWDSGELRLDGGEAHTEIAAEVYPYGLKDTGITWHSSNESIAAVDESGNITAYAPGDVIIEATHTASGKTADAELRVIRPVTGIFMPTTEITMYLGGAPRQLETWLTPDDASIDDLRWTSKNPSVAEVDAVGRVKPAGAGMTEIIASDSEDKVHSKCFVTVVNQSVNVEKVAIQNKDNNVIKLGDSLTTVATVFPDNAKNKTLHWSSDNEEIASVNGNGTVRGTGIGTALITAESANGVTDSIRIEVTEAGDDGLDLGNDFLDGFSLLDDINIEDRVVYTPYDLSLEEMAGIQMASDPPPKIWQSGGSINASARETAEYLDPNAFCRDAYKYQFLDLSRSNGISEESLNAFLENKGMLRGQAAAFIQAANEFGVSEIYLAVHACLESGNGTSQLARGTEVNGVTVYNMFGIAAYDTNAVYSGSQYAYNAGWTSVEAAIRGGAEWISSHYINSGSGRQNTLYKMRWNPENPGEHQYATDVGWAVKQAISMGRMFDSFGEAVLTYDVPVYSGMIPPIIED